MYHGLHTGPNPLQQTYDELQTRAMHELNDEIHRLKEIIADKDTEIDRLQQICDEGKVQKQLAQLLEENNELRLQSKKSDELQTANEELRESVHVKTEQSHRLQEQIALLNEQCTAMEHKHDAVLHTLQENANVAQQCQEKEDEIGTLHEKMSQYESLIEDLQSATKTKTLQTEIEARTSKYESLSDEHARLQEQHGELRDTHEVLRTKYGELLREFDAQIAGKQTEHASATRDLNGTLRDLECKRGAAVDKNVTLRAQMRELQHSLHNQQQLNMQLIKGYDLEDAINELQQLKNETLNVRQKLKESTRLSSKKEQTNLVLLRQNQMLSQTLEGAGDGQARHALAANESSKTTLHFDHVHEIGALKSTIETLRHKIDVLESDKYQLLLRAHDCHDGDGDGGDERQHKAEEVHKFAISGLTTQQQQEIRKYVGKIRKQALMPIAIDTDCDSDSDSGSDADDEDGDADDDIILPQMQTKHAEPPQSDNQKDVSSTAAVMHAAPPPFQNAQAQILELTEEQALVHLLGVSEENIAALGEQRHRLQQMVVEHGECMRVALQRLDDNTNGTSAPASSVPSRAALLREIEQLQGFKHRHAKLEQILHEKHDSELIRKVDAVTRDNMVLLVNEKRLKREYVALTRERKLLYEEYVKLVSHATSAEHYLSTRLRCAHRQNDTLCAWLRSILRTICAHNVPLEHHRHLEIEYQSLQQTNDALSRALHSFEAHSIEFFKCTRENLMLRNKLALVAQLSSPSHKIDNEDEEEDGEDEVVYNAEIASSIRVTEEQYRITLQKYENATQSVHAMEQHSATLHAQIKELRTVCMEQTRSIAALQKQQVGECGGDEYRDLQRRFAKLSVAYETKLVEIEQYKQTAECAVSSLQMVQTKVMHNLQIFNHVHEDTDGAGATEDAADGGVDGEKESAAISSFLRQTQKMRESPAMHTETVKTFEDKVQKLELEVMKREEKLNQLQCKHLNAERTKRVLEANFNCVYSQALHKMSSKYLCEIDRLRAANEQLHECVSGEQGQTRDMLDEMLRAKTTVRSLEIERDDLRDLLTQCMSTTAAAAAATGGDGDADQAAYLRNWQQKCTNLEIVNVKRTHENESLQNEIAFVRGEKAKYLANIGSLQKQLTIARQDLDDIRHEISKTTTTTTYTAVATGVFTDTKLVQTELAIGDDDGLVQRLQHKIGQLQHAIDTLQNESLCADQKTQSAAQNLQVMLETAKETIVNLQTLVSEKNASIEEYKQMIDKLLSKLKTQQARYTQHMSEWRQRCQEVQQQQQNMVDANHTSTNSAQRPQSQPQWVEMSELSVALQEKENVIAKLRERNLQLATVDKQQAVKLEILNTRIDEYHATIQELNRKSKSLSESLASLKKKLTASHAENSSLQNEYKALQQKEHEQEKVARGQASDDHGHGQNESEIQIQRLEREHKLLRSSLQSEIEHKSGRMSELQMANQNWKTKQQALAEELRKVQEELTGKRATIHKLQIQISNTQKDKIGMQEKHSLSLKMNGKKMSALEKQMEATQKQLKETKSELDRQKRTASKLQSENNRFRERQKQPPPPQQQQQQPEEEKKEMEEIRHGEAADTTVWKQKYEDSQLQVVALKRTIEVTQMQQLKQLKLENASIQRKYELVKDNYADNKALAKLLDELDAKDAEVLELHGALTELQFEREKLQIEVDKGTAAKQKRSAGGLLDGSGGVLQISSRNDPQLQNLIDSMRFMVSRLKKENAKLKEQLQQQKKHKAPQKEKEAEERDTPQHKTETAAKSLRIANLLKENRSLQKKLQDLQQQQVAVKEDGGDASKEKDKEFERVVNLYRKQQKELQNAQQQNEKYQRTERFKSEEIEHLKALLENERTNCRQQISEIETIWKRKMSLTTDDVARYKHTRKELESELAHKTQINGKMSTEIKALIELVDHSKRKMLAQQEMEGEKSEKLKALQKENEALKSELNELDEDFFNEIEDLKYREANAQKTILELQQKLSDHGLPTQITIASDTNQ